MEVLSPAALLPQEVSQGRFLTLCRPSELYQLTQLVSEELLPLVAMKKCLDRGQKPSAGCGDRQLGTGFYWYGYLQSPHPPNKHNL